MLLASAGPGGPATFDFAEAAALGNPLGELEADPGDRDRSTGRFGCGTRWAAWEVQDCGLWVRSKP